MIALANGGFQRARIYSPANFNPWHNNNNKNNNFIFFYKSAYMYQATYPDAMARLWHSERHF